jgi:chromate transport protein ChrA
MHIVKSVGVLSVAKILGMMYACMGLILAPFLLLIGVMASALGQQKNPLAGFFSVGIAVLMPIFYGLMGFIVGLLGALLYNLFARWVGGFELQLEVQSQTLTAPYPIIPPTNPVTTS